MGCRLFDEELNSLLIPTLSSPHSNDKAGERKLLHLLYMLSTNDNFSSSTRKLLSSLTSIIPSIYAALHNVDNVAQNAALGASILREAISYLNANQNPTLRYRIIRLLRRKRARNVVTFLNKLHKLKLLSRDPNSLEHNSAKLKSLCQKLRAFSVHLQQHNNDQIVKKLSWIKTSRKICKYFFTVLYSMFLLFCCMTVVLVPILSFPIAAATVSTAAMAAGPTALRSLETWVVKTSDDKERRMNTEKEIIETVWQCSQETESIRLLLLKLQKDLHGVVSDVANVGRADTIATDVILEIVKENLGEVESGLVNIMQKCNGVREAISIMVNKLQVHHQ